MNQAERVVWRYLFSSRPGRCIEATFVLATESRVALSNAIGNTVVIETQYASRVARQEIAEMRGALKKQNRDLSIPGAV